MGLDQFWFREPTSKEKAVALLESKHLNAPIKFGYHRKYYDLASLMFNYFKDDNYEVEITTEILKDVAKFANNKKDNYLLSVIDLAKEYLANNIKVIYSESW